MTRAFAYKKLSAICLSVILVNGCVRVPPPEQPFQPPSPLRVNNIVTMVKCELERLVVTQIYSHPQLWPIEPWYIRVHLKLNIDDASHLNSGISLTTQFQNANNSATRTSAIMGSSSMVATVPQYFALGARSGIAGVVNRSEDVEFGFSIPQIKPYKTIEKKFEDQAFALKKSKHAALSKEIDDIKLHRLREVLWPYLKTLNSCYTQAAISIDSDLGLSEWLDAALAQALPNPSNIQQLSREPQPGRLALISHQVNFIVTITGDMAPAWKLVRLPASASSSLASIVPENIDTLIVAMGQQSEAVEAKIQTTHLRPVLTCQRRSIARPVSCVIELGLPL